MERLSPGRLTATWLVLRVADRLGGRIPREVLRRDASRSSLRSGGLPISDGMRLAVAGGLLAVIENDVALTGRARRLLTLGSEDEPEQEARQAMASLLLLNDPPPWVAYWQGAPDSADLVIPEGERRLLEECGLYPEPGPERFEEWAWWQALRRVPLPQEASAARRIIGDAGEALTVQFERDRLIAGGYPELAARVRWVAQESAAYGFDVLSYAGPGHLTAEMAVAIEVKSMAGLMRDGLFHMFLTWHEWATAEAVGERYRFHLWEGVDPGPPVRARRMSPFVVTAALLREHLPLLPACRSNSCRWESASLNVPVSPIGDATDLNR